MPRNLLYWTLPVFTGMIGWVCGYLSIVGKLLSGSADKSGSLEYRTPVGSTPAQAPSAVLTPKEHATKNGIHTEDGNKLTEILDYASSLHRQVAAQRYFESMETSRFPEMLAELVKLQATRGESAAEEFFRVWVRRSPQEAATYLSEMPPSMSRYPLRSAFVRVWSRIDYEAAKAWVATIPADEIFPGYGQLPPLRPLEPALGPEPTKPTIDPRIAFEKYLRDGKAIAGGLSPVFSQWGKVDPNAAAKAALTIQTSSDREDAIRSLVLSWAMTDPRAALAWIREHPEPTRSATTAIYVIAQKDLELVRQAAATSQDSFQRAIFGAAVADQLTSTDLDGAIAYLETMAPADRKFALGAYRKWAEKDPANAVNAYQALYPRDESFAKEQFMYSQEIRRFLTSAIAKDPPAVASAVLDLDPQTRAEVLYDIGKSWCHTDGAAAAAWAAALPAGPGRNDALRQFLVAWAEHDSTQATSFVTALPSDSDRSAAAEGFATAIIASDADAALAWIRTIPDEQERLSALKRAWSRWSRTIGAPAYFWRDKSTDLSPQEKAAIAR